MNTTIERPFMQLQSVRGGLVCLKFAVGTKCPVTQMEEQQVKAYREIERENMNKLLLEYSMICEQAGVRAHILHIEMECIEEGIVELISQHGIKKLVMGAAADKQYSKLVSYYQNMMEPKSKKAIYVRSQALMSCHIWFICRGNLIHIREGRLGVSVEVASLIGRASPSTENGKSGFWRSRSTTKLQNDQQNLSTSVPDFHRVRSDAGGMKVFALSPNGLRGVTPHCTLNIERSVDRWGGFSWRSPSLNSPFSSSGDMVFSSALTATPRKEDGLESHAIHHSQDDYRHTSPSSILEGHMKDELCDQLEQAMAAAENSRQEAFDESVRRRKAEKDAIDAFRRAKTSERVYTEELRQRKETEEALLRGREDLEKLKQQVDVVLDELRISMEQRSSLKTQIANSEKMVQELEHKMFSAVELLQKYKKQRDELHAERDKALKVAEELRKNQGEAASNTIAPQLFSDFSLAEIEGATRNFDNSLKIGEGGYGSIYKGLLRHTEVAIKMPHPNSLQGPSEFQKEVNILSNLRHPNLVTLIGACPEAWILVYEYLPNGSLEDRLSCRDNTPPLSWQTRIKMATELCSVLLYLHYCSPRGIVHGNLKPANILLDSNHVCKLSGFGVYCFISQDESSSNNTIPCCRTDPMGASAYMDPEFLATGELTAKSDVYSFGIILLQLLTGRTALGLLKEVQSALDKGSLKNLLDPTAGDWPFVQAQQLTHLAMRCCDKNCKGRPDLASDVLRMLERMRISCGGSSFRLRSEEHCQTPPYFVCPIFQEVMQDPHVAADGFTYELEAVRGWIDSGHDTSPMTNLSLSHCNLVPNHALRSAIQEWLQQP
ncbi:hypothetical protein RHMOL_Rhmol12G0125300 [Rhododendron molle]|uniref:Uncharacterized protein n=1 Tax=Rhododendron molle TaxID=49168 RepID=A0ACC0LIF5_RHOML|nr:hypothetical protein RHMOL_Rhmol12G0125300 [Rhododendron molle]